MNIHHPTPGHKQEFQTQRFACWIWDLVLSLVFSISVFDFRFSEQHPVSALTPLVFRVSYFGFWGLVSRSSTTENPPPIFRPSQFASRNSSLPGNWNRLLPRDVVVQTKGNRGFSVVPGSEAGSYLRLIDFCITQR